MKQNKLPKDNTKKIFTAICMLIFLLSFSFVIHKDWDLIFKKDLYVHNDDESVNSVVAANLTRKIFPPMVRINPLIEKIDSWQEGPYWQHIPPLFTYIPLFLFKIDQHVTIEMKRLAYAGVILLTGIIFLFLVFLFEKSFIGSIVATFAAVLFIFTKFTRQLITGISFGASDTVLALTVIISFAAICWYLNYEQQKRCKYPTWQLLVISLIVALPVVAKNLLGAIPAATFFILICKDYRSMNRKVLASIVVFFVILFIFFTPLYFSSPATFKNEIFLPLGHITQNLEGWAKPWHFFLTVYIPFFYTQGLTPLYYLSIATGLWLLVKNKVQGKTKTILILSIVWFLWNLLAISIARVKIPNFIFQTYLLSLFFTVYVPLLLISKTNFYCRLMEKLKKIYQREPLFIYRTLFTFFIILLSASFYSYGGLLFQIPKTRAANYEYNSEREKFYHFAEKEQANGANINDLFILNSSENDCWFRYYIIFLTGAESRTFSELLTYN